MVGLATLDPPYEPSVPFGLIRAINGFFVNIGKVSLTGTPSPTGLPHLANPPQAGGLAYAGSAAQPGRFTQAEGSARLTQLDARPRQAAAKK
jgi:hypothetical protein